MKLRESKLETHDCIIFGGGPAGVATALSLQARDPALGAVVIEATSYDRPRIGEVLPAAARALLDHLGIWEAFQRERYRPVHATSAAWEDPAVRENHFIYSFHGQGWHLDRVSFDRFLSRQAAERGIEVRLATRLDGVDRAGDLWSLRLSDGSRVQARFVVDATGRRAAFARKVGARQVAFDRLAGFACFFTLDDDPQPGTLIEAFPEGWWYTALAGDRRVVTCMTDTDIARRSALGDRARWLSLLSETRWIGPSIGSGIIDGYPIVCAANSMRLNPVCQAGWLAVGDAASAFDPLSSQGIVKSLRSGIFGSYAIADYLGKSDPAGLTRYESFIRREFANYQRVHAEYCAEQRRWPDSSFWRRRRGGE